MRKNEIKKMFACIGALMLGFLMAFPVSAATLTAEEEYSLKALTATWANESAIPTEYKYDYTKASTYENKVQVTLPNGTSVLIVGDSYAKGNSKNGDTNTGKGAGLGGPSSASTDSVKTNAKNIMQEANIVTNKAGVGTLMLGFKEVIGLAVGVLAYLIVIGLPLFSALDVAYITIPVLREKADDAKDSHSGGGNMVVKSNGKFRWISDEAVYACKAASMEEGKGALSIYFGKRVWTYIVCAIVLYLLISGNIQVVTQIAVSLVSGLMGVIERLGI